MSYREQRAPVATIRSASLMRFLVLGGIKFLHRPRVRNVERVRGWRNVSVNIEMNRVFSWSQSDSNGGLG